MLVEFGLSFAPEAHLRTLDAFSDYGFALAHLALDHPDYAAYYRARHGNVFLDNSFHELGEAMSIVDLEQAIELIQPRVVAAPDAIDDWEWTVEQYTQFRTGVIPGLTPVVAASITGSNSEEMTACLHAYMALRSSIGIPAIFALPYKCPRAQWLEHGSFILPTNSNYHLFGYNDYYELKVCIDALESRGIRGITIDTAKPVNYAFSNINFTHSTRSGEAQRPDYFIHFSTDQLRRAVDNIMRFRLWCKTLVAR